MEPKNNEGQWQPLALGINQGQYKGFVGWHDVNCWKAEVNNRHGCVFVCLTETQAQAQAAVESYLGQVAPMQAALLL